MALFLALLISVSSLAAPAKERCHPGRFGSHEWFPAKVLRVSDGDTIEVDGGNGLSRRIRLLHIDTAETQFMNFSQGKAGQLGTQRLKELLPAGSKVEIHLEEAPCDLYGRFLGVVFREGVEINLHLVREGLAASLCFAPNLKNCERYIEEAKSAFSFGGTVFHRYQAALPHEFRFEKSGRPEAPWVGDYESKKVLPFSRWGEIEGLNRIFFTKESQILAPYKLEK